jgi:hypothetical protein
VSGYFKKRKSERHYIFILKIQGVKVKIFWDTPNELKIEMIGLGKKNLQG